MSFSIKFAALYQVYLKPETLPEVQKKLDSIAERKPAANGISWDYYRKQDVGFDPNMLSANQIENQVRVTMDEAKGLLQLQTNQSPHARPHDAALICDDFIPQVIDNAQDQEKLNAQFPYQDFSDSVNLALGGLWELLPGDVMENPNKYKDDRLILEFYIQSKDWERFEALLSHPDFDPNKSLYGSVSYVILTESDLISDPQYNRYFKALYDHPKTNLFFKDRSGDTPYRWAAKKGNAELLSYLEAKGVLA